MQNFCGQARFPSGPWRNICLITHQVPKWRNGRRRGFKIPRLHGRVSSTLTLGTSTASNYFRYILHHTDYTQLFLRHNKWLSWSVDQNADQTSTLYL